MPDEIIEGYEVKVPTMTCAYCGREVVGGIGGRCGCSGKENGVELIRKERIRQIEQEGWTVAHDAEHANDELAWAAACYAAPEKIFTMYSAQSVPQAVTDFIDPWPWDRKWDKRRQHDRLRQLVIAGALIAAEIDRLQQKGS